MPRIVIPDDATPAEQHAAEELQRYIERASGGVLSIGNGTDAVVLLGRAALFGTALVSPYGEDSHEEAIMRNYLSVTGALWLLEFFYFRII